MRNPTVAIISGLVLKMCLISCGNIWSSFCCLCCIDMDSETVTEAQSVHFTSFFTYLFIVLLYGCWPLCSEMSHFAVIVHLAVMHRITDLTVQSETECITLILHYIYCLLFISPLALEISCSRNVADDLWGFIPKYKSKQNRCCSYSLLPAFLCTQQNVLYRSSVVYVVELLFYSWMFFKKNMLIFTLAFCVASLTVVPLVCTCDKGGGLPF